MFTDSDSVWGSGAALDQYNRRLEKALSAYGRTHEVKVNYVYDLPIGPGKHFLKHGLLSQVIGGWRIGSVQRYASGTPITTFYDNWRAPTKGDKFDPNVDPYFKAPTTASFAGDVPTITTQGFFPLQPHDRIGNMTRNNPKMRNFPRYNENVSLAKTFTMSQERRRTADLRFEAFNVLNRTQFGAPNTNLNDAANLGLVRTQANTARRMQFALKVNW